MKSKNIFIQMEEKVLSFWQKGKIFEKSVEKKAPQGDYVFYDGPPFATGLPHYGHLAASIMKDVVPRFWTMRGFKVERVWGWDCHGLPIENIIEKELKTESKKDIEEKIGVEKFNEACRNKVLFYADEWKKVITRLGRWVDMENPYKTMDIAYMETIWWVFKQLWDKGLVYKDYRSLHICPRCETTLSQSEVTEGYRDIKDLSCVVKFKLEKGQKIGGFKTDDNIYVLAWTTTPWTLLGNVVLAVGEKIDYVRLKIENEYYILAKERIEEIIKDKKYKITEEFSGKDLVGGAYKPLFDYYYKDKGLENRKNGWKIYTGDFVTTEEGTGIVHIAPAFGEDDMNLGKKHKLPFIQHLEMDGRIKKEATDFAGENVKPKDNIIATDKKILYHLRNKKMLFSEEEYEHSYPHCWRCDTPLLNYAYFSWFVNIIKIKSKIIRKAKEINWSPVHIKKGRFGKWLEGARDWSISRQRFWASVIPIWECACGERKVIGSVAELKELSGQEITDLHKHIVDKIIFPCEKCKGKMRRIPDVFDCWFESGSMPYAQFHYPFENKEKFDKIFPAQFIAEGSDQTRAWFYYLHAIACGIKSSPAYKNVIVNGIVLAEDGKKMSKKLKNYPDPMYILNTYGSDSLRYYILTSSVMMAENLNFSEKGVSDSLRKLNMLLWNVYKFYSMYASKKAEEKEPESRNILDKWIVSRLNQLIKEVTEGMENYNLPKATRPIVAFIDDLSTWYLRRSRNRFKKDDEKDKKLVLEITGYVLLKLAKVIAPFTPFIAEALWQELTGNNFSDKDKSVHLEAWPKTGKIDEKVIGEMERARKVVELGLAKRDEVGIRVRQPLSQLRVENGELEKEYLELVKDELNVKEVVCKKDRGELSVELDTELSPELINEGIKREIVRFVNAMRKDNDLTIKDRIAIFYQTESEDIKKAIKEYSKDITRDTLADSLEEGVDKISRQVKINNNNITLSIKKN